MVLRTEGATRGLQQRQGCRLAYVTLDCEPGNNRLYSLNFLLWYSSRVRSATLACSRGNETSRAPHQPTHHSLLPPPPPHPTHHATMQTHILVPLVAIATAIILGEVGPTSKPLRKNTIPKEGAAAGVLLPAALASAAAGRLEVTVGDPADFRIFQERDCRRLARSALCHGHRRIPLGLFQLDWCHFDPEHLFGPHGRRRGHALRMYVYSSERTGPQCSSH